MRRRPAWCWRKRGVRTREEQAQTTDEREAAKQEAELSVALRLLEQFQPQLHGRLVSGDALYCQKALCCQVRAAGAHYLFAVKANQPHRLDDVAVLFADPPPGKQFLTASTHIKHGGRRETRRLRASATLAAYLQQAGWPDVGRVLAVEAHACWPAHPARPARHEVRYCLSSLPVSTPPADLLRWVRQHGHIENRLHWEREVTLGEDACQVRSGCAPQALAAVRNAVLGLLHAHGVSTAAAAVRTCAWSPPAVRFRLLGLPPP